MQTEAVRFPPINPPHVQKYRPGSYRFKPLGSYDIHKNHGTVGIAKTSLRTPMEHITSSGYVVHRGPNTYSFKIPRGQSVKELRILNQTPRGGSLMRVVGSENSENEGRLSIDKALGPYDDGKVPNNQQSSSASGQYIMPPGGQSFNSTTNIPPPPPPLRQSTNTQTSAFPSPTSSYKSAMSEDSYAPADMMSSASVADYDQEPLQMGSPIEEITDDQPPVVGYANNYAEPSSTSRRMPTGFLMPAPPESSQPPMRPRLYPSLDESDVKEMEEFRAKEEAVASSPEMPPINYTRGKKKFLLKVDTGSRSGTWPIESPSPRGFENVSKKPPLKQSKQELETSIDYYEQYQAWLTRRITQYKSLYDLSGSPPGEDRRTKNARKGDLKKKQNEFTHMYKLCSRRLTNLKAALNVKNLGG